MNYDLKIYSSLGFNPRHLETIDKVYGSIIDEDFNLKDQPKRIKNIIRRLAELPAPLRPNFTFESVMFKPARKLGTFARGVFSSKKSIK